MEVYPYTLTGLFCKGEKNMRIKKVNIWQGRQLNCPSLQNIDCPYTGLPVMSPKLCLPLSSLVSIFRLIMKGY